MKLSWSRRINITVMTIWRLAHWPQIAKDWSTLLDRGYIKHSFKIMPNVHLCQLHLMTEGMGNAQNWDSHLCSKRFGSNQGNSANIDSNLWFICKDKREHFRRWHLNCWLQLQYTYHFVIEDRTWLQRAIFF